MRRHALILFWIAGIAVKSEGQTVPDPMTLVRQILQSHVGATGLPQDLVIQGQVVDSAGTRSLRMQVKGKNEIRYEQTQGTQATIAIYNAGRAWVGPAGGSSKPLMPHAGIRRPMELPFLDVITEVDDPRLQVRYDGRETLASSNVYHLALRLPDPTPQSRFLRRALDEEVEFFADTTTGLILRSQRMQAANNSMDFRVPSVLDFSDYRQVSGLMIPFRIVGTIGTPSSGISQVTIVIQSVLVNQGLAESVFQP